MEGFSKEIISQITAAKRIRPASHLSRRLDLRGKTVFTVKEAPGDISEYAFSIDTTRSGWRLGFHIADVSEYVIENSPLDLEAHRRFATVTTENGISPMLPKEIVQLCDLSGGGDKLAVSLLMDIKPNGELINIEFEETVIRIAENCYFSEIDEMACNADPSALMLLREKYASLINPITWMYELAAMFCAKRSKNGGLDCTVFRRIYERDSKGNVSFRRESEPDSRAMIREIGYFASKTVGEFMLKRKLPCMFIGQDTLPEHILKYLYNLTGSASLQTQRAHLLAGIANASKGSEIYGFVCDIIGANLPCSVFSTEPIINASCGYDTVVSFVRPANRYSDLLTQRIIKEMIVAKGNAGNINLNRYKTFVETACKSATEAEKFAFDCYVANNRRLAVQYLLTSNATEFPAYPAFAEGDGSFNLFMECGLHAVIPAEYRGNKEFPVGRPIMVEVITIGGDDEPIAVRPI